MREEGRNGLVESCGFQLSLQVAETYHLWRIPRKAGPCRLLLFLDKNQWAFGFKWL